MNRPQVDKVYVRIISVSLLLSLCSVGVVSPRLCRTIFVSEAETAFVKQACATYASPSSRGKAFTGPERVKLPFRRFFTSISSRLAEMCAGGRADVMPDGRAESLAKPNVSHQGSAFAFCGTPTPELWPSEVESQFYDHDGPRVCETLRLAVPIRAGPIAA